jgi:hypothetical protein
MPNLLFFAPCEKVLIDQNNTSSMIAIMEELTVQTIAGVAVPAGAVIPMQWSVLSMWEQSSAWDKDRGFEQRTALVSPEGKILVEVVAPFTRYIESTKGMERNRSFSSPNYFENSAARSPSQVKLTLTQSGFCLPKFSSAHLLRDRMRSCPRFAVLCPGAFTSELFLRRIREYTGDVSPRIHSPVDRQERVARETNSSDES